MDSINWVIQLFEYEQLSTLISCLLESTVLKIFENWKLMLILLILKTAIGLVAKMTQNE